MSDTEMKGHLFLFTLQQVHRKEPVIECNVLNMCAARLVAGFNLQIETDSLAV